MKPLFSGSFNKRLVSNVFGFGLRSELPVDDLVALNLSSTGLKKTSKRCSNAMHSARVWIFE
jgi:hypothetical protein